MYFTDNNMFRISDFTMSNFFVLNCYYDKRKSDVCFKKYPNYVLHMACPCL